MPELAEVDFFRRQWDPGLGQRILRIALHAEKRVLRSVDPEAFVRSLSGSVLLSSSSHGKQMLFRSSAGAWLGIHLGMTGELRLERARFVPGPHDHLVLSQREQSLVFRDPRQFGRIRFHQGATAPEWWSDLPPALASAEFTHARVREFLRRHARAPIKAVLLSQECFPGVGNWMADETLWRAQVHPRLRAGRVSAAASLALYRALRYVCAGAMRAMAVEYRDPPRSWLFRHRWKAGGRCPKHRVTLERAEVGGRTTVWCPECQL